MDIEELKENFEFLDDWEDRYRYLLDLGAKLPPMAEEEKNETNKVNGCTSQVWIKSSVKEDEKNQKTIDFVADSDAHIVRGLIAIVRVLFIGKTFEEIKTIDEEQFFTDLGLHNHLSPSRRNGLAAMVEKIKSDAANMI
ncbi:MAG: SufE family protein [Alphaproteobacteria bacterium]